MKISNRTHPLIKCIKNGALEDWALSYFPLRNQEDANSRVALASAFSVLALNAGGNKNINYISQPFGEALKSARGKLSRGDVQIDSQSGVVIWGEFTFCYMFRGPVVLSDYPEFNLFVFHHNHLIVFGTKHKGDANARYVVPGMAKYFLDYHGLSSGHFDSVAGSWQAGLFESLYAMLFEVLVFIKYAQIQVKEVPAGKKVKDFNCKYVNDTPSDIRILDSTWFTTLVKSEAFKVRGHFRLQPCGEGLKDKKLIWISDYEKQGYTRHFKRPLDTSDNAH